MSYIYLGSPYTHKDPAVMEQRYRITEAVTAYLLLSGVHVYSPIVHCHTMAVRYNLPRDIEFWRAYNFAMLEPASEFHTLVLPGWEDSRGLKEERVFAYQHKIPHILCRVPDTVKEIEEIKS